MEKNGEKEEELVNGEIELNDKIDKGDDIMKS